MSNDPGVKITKEAQYGDRQDGEGRRRLDGYAGRAGAYHRCRQLGDQTAKMNIEINGDAAAVTACRHARAEPLHALALAWRDGGSWRRGGRSRQRPAAAFP